MKKNIITRALKTVSKKLNSYSEWFNNIYTTIFNTSSTNPENRINKSRSKATVDLTFPDTVNYDLAMDLYYNSRAGYKLGAFFCYSIIAIPLTFMGFPHYDIEDWKRVKNPEWWEERLKFYNENMIMDKQDIQKVTHITGTFGVYPWFDSKKGYVKLYFIKNKYITDMYVNPDTQELTGIRTDIYYKFTWDNGVDYNFEETKIYTAKQIKTIRTGAIPPGVRGTEIRRNPTGELPVLFTNDKEPGKFEGHSDLERTLPLIKAYAEINYRAHEEAGNITAKQIQTVNNKNEWLENNGYTSVNEVSIHDKDFVLNLEDEDTKIEVPLNLVENHVKLMSLDFWNIVQTSKIPEIFWGLEAAGNYASAGKQDKFGLAFVKEKQKQAQKPHVQLEKQIMNLDALAYNQTVPEGLICTWDDFDSMTEVERAEVFDKWTSGFSKLAENHSIDLQGIHTMLIDLTRGKIEEDYETFKKQIKEYGGLRAMLDQEYGGMRDFEGTGEDETIDDIVQEMNTNKIFKLNSTPFSITDTLKNFAFATEELLKTDYDKHGYEILHHCLENYKKMNKGNGNGKRKIKV